MLRLKRWGVLLLSATLVFSLVTGCGKDEEKEAKPKEEQSQTDQNNQKNDQQAEESPVPVVNVDLGMDPKDVVAEYEGGKLTAEQFENYLQVQAFINPQAGLAIQQKDPEALKMFVDSYVAEAAMASKAPEIKEVEAEAKKLSDQIKSQYTMVFGGDQAKVDKQMKDQGVTDEELMEFFIRYKEVEAYLRSKVTDAELQKSYDEGKKEGNFVVASVRHILISVGENPGAPADPNKKAKTDEEAKKLAQEMTDRLRKGEDWNKLAKEFSDDPGSKDNGGLYADADVSQWVPEFKKAAVELELNKVSDPVKSDFGYHVMKVEKRSEKSFGEVKEQIRSQFVNQKYDEFLGKDLKAIVKKVNLPEAPKK